jgi:hypothetical protein
LTSIFFLFDVHFAKKQTAIYRGVVELAVNNFLSTMIALVGWLVGWLAVATFQTMGVLSQRESSWHV